MVRAECAAVLASVPALVVEVADYGQPPWVASCGAAIKVLGIIRGLAETRERACVREGESRSIHRV